MRRVEFQSVFRAPSQNFKILAIPNVLAHGKLYEHCFTKKHDGHKLYAKSRADSSFDRFFVHRFEISQYWPFPMYRGKSYEHSFVKNRDGHKLCTKSRRVEVEFRSVFLLVRKDNVLCISFVQSSFVYTNRNSTSRTTLRKVYDRSERFRVRAAGFSQGKVTTFPCSCSVCARALLALVPAPAIRAGDGSLFPNDEFRSVFHAPSRNFKILAIPNVLAHGKSYEQGFPKKWDGHKLCAKSCIESDQFFLDHLGISKY
ncbi:hypothetical protein BHM03_00022020 [Ensete ventricosum]|nr:hypothetical protein BHM03_00022020 [Ensete ventricosum]